MSKRPLHKLPLHKLPLHKLIAPMAATVALGLTLGGCVSFGSKPPPQLLTIRPDSSFTTGQTLNSQSLPSLLILLPDVPRTIATTRVPVQISPTSVAYVKDAQWTEAPRDLFYQLLSQTITAGGAVFLINEDQYGLKPSRRLSGALLDFGVDEASKEAVVTYDATLIDNQSGEAIRRRFAARVPVGEIEAKKIAEPINKAANQVATQVAEWVKQGK